MLRYFQRMTTRNERAGIDDRWHKRVKAPDGATEVKVDALSDIDELPSQYTPGDAE